jgi:hypothetical protein
VKTMVEQFRATGNVTGKKRGGSKLRVHMPDTASVASSPTQKSVRQLAAENEVLPLTAWSILRTNLRMHLYKIHVFQSDNCVPRKVDKVLEEFGDHLQQNPHILKHIGLSDEAYFHLTWTLTDKTCVSGALCIHVKFTNPLCMPRKSWCGVRFPCRA